MAFTNKLEFLEPFLQLGDYASACQELIHFIEDSDNLGTIKRASIKRKLGSLNKAFDSYSQAVGKVHDSKKFAANIYKLYLIIGQIKSEIEDLDFQLSCDDTLVEIHPDAALDEAIMLLKSDPQSMKVIGAGRQAFAQKTKENKVVEYYRAVEEALEKTPSSKRPFVIKRITQHKTEIRYREHLRNCFEIVGKNTNFNTYSVIFYGKLAITNTFYIIKNCNGESTLFITLNVDLDDVIDNALVFKTTNKRIITNYEEYFNDFYRAESKNGRIIEGIVDFDRYIPFEEDIYDQYNDMKNFIKGIPNTSIRKKHLKYAMDSIYTQLKGLNASQLVYNYTRENENIVYWFEKYMGDLGINKSYRTVSILKFWEVMQSSGDTFRYNQEDALEKGAKLHRILFIDSSGMSLDKYEDEKGKAKYIKEVDFRNSIIKYNLQLSEKFDNYNFHLLFSNNPKEIAGFENFAIWSDDNEPKYKVLFRMTYAYFNQKQTKTTLFFANYGNSGKGQEHSNQNLVDGYETIFTKYLIRVKRQYKELSDFINADIGIEEYNSNQELLSENIKVLKKCGINDVKAFLNRRIEMIDDSPNFG